MSLQSRLELDLREAIKNQEKEKKLFLSVVVGEINLKGKLVSDDDVLKILNTLKKESIECKNEFEIQILNSYLPVLLSENETKVLIQKIIEINGFTSKKEFGSLMKILREYKNVNLKLATTLANGMLN
jgi:uncharacterized protein YqeY